jgi:phage FluMu protein Com
MVRSSEKLVDATGEWECMECGYILAGTEGHRPKKCPECDAPASALEFFSDEEDAIINRMIGDEYEDEESEEFDEDEENESAFHSQRS